MRKIFIFMIVLLSTIVVNCQTVMFGESFNSGEGRFVVEEVMLPEGGSYIWQPGVYSNKGYMKASAYISGEAKESEGWLVSPMIDLSSATTATLTFEHAAMYQNGDLTEEMTLWVDTTESTTFSTQGWVEIMIPTYPEEGGWNWIESGAINLSRYVGAGKPKLRFAFKYKSTNEFADAWQVREFKIEGDGEKDDIFDPSAAEYTEAKVTYWGNDYADGASSFVIDLMTDMDKDADGLPASEGAMLTFSVYTAKSTSYCGNYSLSSEEEVVGTMSQMYSFFQQYASDGTVPKTSIFDKATLNVSYAGNKKFTYVFSATDFLGSQFAGQLTVNTPAVDTSGNSINHLIEEENTPSGNMEVSTDYKLYTQNGSIVVESEIGTMLTIYNVNGVMLYKTEIIDRFTEIEGLRGEGLVLVQVGSSVCKVIL